MRDDDAILADVVHTCSITMRWCGAPPLKIIAESQASAAGGHPDPASRLSLALARADRMRTRFAKTPVREWGWECITNAVAAVHRCAETTQKMEGRLTAQQWLARWLSGDAGKRKRAAEVEAAREAEIEPLAVLHDYISGLERDHEFVMRLSQWLWQGDSSLDGVPAPLVAILRTIPRKTEFQAGPTSAVIEAELARRRAWRPPDSSPPTGPGQ